MQGSHKLFICYIHKARTPILRVVSIAGVIRLQSNVQTMKVSDVHYVLRTHIFVDRNKDYKVNILVIVLVTTKHPDLSRYDYIREQTLLTCEVHCIYIMMLCERVTALMTALSLELQKQIFFSVTPFDSTLSTKPFLSNGLQNRWVLCVSDRCPGISAIDIQCW